MLFSAHVSSIYLMFNNHNQCKISIFSCKKQKVKLENLMSCAFYEKGGDFAEESYKNITFKLLEEFLYAQLQQISYNKASNYMFIFRLLSIFIS